MSKSCFIAYRLEVEPVLLGELDVFVPELVLVLFWVVLFDVVLLFEFVFLYVVLLFDAVLLDVVLLFVFCVVPIFVDV